MTSHHPYTPSPSELPGLLSGEVTEVWVEMEEQPVGVNMAGVPWGINIAAGLKAIKDGCQRDGDSLVNSRGELMPESAYRIRPPYAVGDVLMMLKPVRDHHEPLADIEPDTAPFPTLTITAVTPQQRDGVWGFAYEVATTKGNDDE